MGPERTDRRIAVVIEDDADIRSLLEAVLTQAGFDVVATSNGLDGLAAVRAYDPVVTTLDVSMPGIDGFETAKRIRAFSPTYLVMLTARDDEIDTLQGLEAGADDYLTKPFRPRELRARIEAMLRRPRHSLTADAAIPSAPLAVPAASSTAMTSASAVTGPPSLDAAAERRVAAPISPFVRTASDGAVATPLATMSSPAFRPTPVASAPTFVPAVDAARAVLDPAPHEMGDSNTTTCD
ncbi:response regulator [Cryobacterium sp. TMT1-3]|uniref:Response regulator n=1 Tax=Cryobacterium luteum TaxID=1424661 RepID=A0A1H8A6S5_9MICO|nr:MULTISPECIES: response regulator transcription factor [Cryobacterium]TFB88387.1 response regulator [Cryobacterium luteum]TFC24414.1 response regulator [Cryobacterium sp. TMT1-3]SEM65594.1 Response regulator receiver domain-containing protein [Cryobacterium luteum]